MSYSIYIRNQERTKNPINKNQVEIWVNELIKWLFDINQEHNNYRFFRNKEKLLQLKLQDILATVTDDTNQIIVNSNHFFDSLEQIHFVLINDLETIINFDPAAKSKEEVLIAYPGFFAITAYRIANVFWKLNIPIIPRIITEYVHSKTGIDIHPGAQIGENFFIDHGTGIVIGETTKIGNNVKIYQGVTLGALSVSKDNASAKRHPTIENNVTIIDKESAITDVSIANNVTLSEQFEVINGATSLFDGMFYFDGGVSFDGNRDFVINDVIITEVSA